MTSMSTIRSKSYLKKNSLNDGILFSKNELFSSDEMMILKCGFPLLFHQIKILFFQTSFEPDNER